MNFSAFAIGASGMQANDLLMDRAGTALTQNSVGFQAIGSFESAMGNATVSGIDPTGTLTPGLGGFSEATLAAFDMGAGADLINLLLAQQGFQVSARVVDTASQTSQVVSLLG